jgi:hypothetical protein
MTPAYAKAAIDTSDPDLHSIRITRHPSRQNNAHYMRFLAAFSPRDGPRSDTQPPSHQALNWARGTET